MIEQSIVNRFWSKVTVIEDEDSCWLWAAGTTGEYGEFWIKDRNYLAHIVSYLITNNLDVGSLQLFQYVCHKCDVELCVRPSHLFLGTPAMNSADMASKGRWNAHYGENHYKAKLTVDTVMEIHRLWQLGGMTQKEIGVLFGVSRSAIAHVTQGNHWGRALSKVS